MKKLYIDVETTGPRYWEHGIHQISGEIHVDGIRDFFDYNVRPFGEDKINPDSLEVTSRTLQDLIGYPPAREVWQDLYGKLTSYVDPFNKQDKFFTYAYNAAFDESFIRIWLMKLDYQYFGSIFRSPIQCIMHKAFVVLGVERANLRDVQLSTVAQHFGVEVDQERLHDALYDVEITRRLDEKLDERLIKGLMQ